MIRIWTPSRLHFGLLNLGGGEPWLDLDGRSALPGRRFGGVGLMIEEPGLAVRAELAETWCAGGPLAERALEFAHRFAATVPSLLPHSLTVEQAPPEHSGLGAGTQLGLAVAKALAIAAGYPEWDAIELAARVGRGLRSAIGVHGFDRGGLIVEAGKRDGAAIGTLVVHAVMPEPWRIVVMLPEGGAGLHGGAERLAFDRLRDDAETALNESLCRLVLLGMLPALCEGDCRVFGEALHDFNARVGEQFARAQGGRYAPPQCAELVAFVRGLSVPGVGQSSWGPTLFAVVEDVQRADETAERVRRRYGEKVKIWVTRPSRGAIIS